MAASIAQLLPGWQVFRSLDLGAPDVFSFLLFNELCECLMAFWHGTLAHERLMTLCCLHICFDLDVSA